MAKFPADGETIVNLIVHQSRCFIATTRGVYEIKDRKAVRIELEVEQPDAKK